MAKRNKKQDPSVEIPQIGEPLANPNFVTPTAQTAPGNFGTGPFPPMIPPVPPTDPEDE